MSNHNNSSSDDIKDDEKKKKNKKELVISMSNEAEKGLIGWFDASSFDIDNEIWNDKSNANNNIYGKCIRGTVKKTETGNIECIYGGINDSIEFPSELWLRDGYTLIFASRYNGSNRNRILNCSNYNWLSGHHGSKSGVAYHNKWLTPKHDIHGSNWVISVDQPDLYRSNGKTRNKSKEKGKTQKITKIMINNGQCKEASDWAIRDIFIFNKLLSIKDIENVEKYLMNEYNKNTIGYKIGYPSNYELYGDIIIDSNNGEEQNIILTKPALLGDDHVPYKLSFNIEFIRKANQQYHGGVHWGSNDMTHTRWSGHKTLEQGALTSNIDRYQKKWRIYGVNSGSPSRQIQDPQNRNGEEINGKKWEIIFHKNNKCEFYVDNVFISGFVAVGVGGYIGFWVQQEGTMKVYNIKVERMRDRTDLEKENESLNEKTKQLEDDNNQMVEANKKLQNVTDEMERKIEDQNKQSQKMNKLNKDQESKLNSKLEENIKKINELQGNIDGKTKQIDTVKQSEEDALNRLNTTLQKINEYEATIKDLKKDNKSLNEKLGKERKTFDEQRQKQSEINAICQKGMKEKAVLLQKQDEEIQELKQRIKEKEEKIKELNTLNDELKNIVNKKDKTIKTLTTENDALLKRQKQSKDEAALLQKKIEEKTKTEMEKYELQKIFMEEPNLAKQCCDSKDGEDTRIIDENKSQNEDIVNQIAKLGIASRDECIAASLLVTNPKDIKAILINILDIEQRNIINLQNDPKYFNCYESDNEPDAPKYAKMKREVRTYTEKSISIDIPVANIVDGVIATVTTVATDGVLAPLLMKQMADVIKNAQWSNSYQNENIVQHFFEKNTYIYMDMHRKVKEINAEWIFQANETEIIAKTRFFYVEADNDSARLQLQTMARKEANEAFKYINNHPDFNWT